MTVLQRAATIAAMTFSLAGLIGASSPGLASDLDRSLIPSATNASAAAVVPQNEPAAEDEEFDSLADAVAAQDDEVAGASDDQALRCLAGAIYFESKGEPLSGQLAVANVIINRTKSGRFPADLCAVVKQRGQFGFVRGGRIPDIDEGRSAWRTAIAVAKVALAAAWDSPAPKALFFNTPNRMPGTNLTRVAMIGNHVFYR